MTVHFRMFKLHDAALSVASCFFYNTYERGDQTSTQKI